MLSRDFTTPGRKVAAGGQAGLGHALVLGLPVAHADGLAPRTDPVAGVGGRRDSNPAIPMQSYAYLSQAIESYGRL
jgi:hypothetical protein